MTNRHKSRLRNVILLGAVFQGLGFEGLGCSYVAEVAAMGHALAAARWSLNFTSVLGFVLKWPIPGPPK